MGEYRKAAESKRQFLDTPPVIVDVLQRIIARYLSKNKRPECFPHKPYEAARFWINHQEPADEYRERVEKIEKDGDVVGWRTPYHDRIAYTLRIFLGLSEPQRAFIVQNVEMGIPWRGDKIELYSTIVDETKKMKTNPQLYIASAKQILEAMQ